MKPSLRFIDEQAPARCQQNSAELQSLKELFKAQVPEYHKQDCTYPVYAEWHLVKQFFRSAPLQQASPRRPLKQP